MRFCLGLFVLSHLQMRCFLQLIYSRMMLNYFGILFYQRTQGSLLLLKKCIYVHVCVCSQNSKSRRTSIMHLYAAKLCFLCIVCGCYCCQSHGAGSMLIGEVLHFMCFSLCFMTEVILCTYFLQLLPFGTFHW